MSAWPVLDEYEPPEPTRGADYCASCRRRIGAWVTAGGALLCDGCESLRQRLRLCVPGEGR